MFRAHAPALVIAFTFACSSIACKSESTTPDAGDAAHGGESSGTGGDAGKSGSGGQTAGDSGKGGSSGDAGAGGSTGKSGSGGSSGTSGAGGAGGAAGTSAGSGGTSGSGGASGSSGTGGSGGSAAIPTTETVFVSGYGSTIHVLSLDTKTGALTSKSTVNGGTAPSYMAFAPDLEAAYAINEADAPNSTVTAFSLDTSTGKLTKLNSAATGGSGSPHLAVHPSGNWVVVTHYNSGHTSVMGIDAEGRVSAAGTPDKGPNGGCENAHQAVFDRSGEHLLVPCLGSNYVIQFKFKDGKLSYNDPATIAVSGGPRHLALDPQEHYAYVLSELDSLITSFKYDAATGKLSDPQTVNSYQQTKGASAHIVVHGSGKWLYASNRMENSIGLFSIDSSGRPHAVSFTKDMIATPRDFSIDPSGRWLISANQAGAQNVLVFEIDQDDGQLTRKTAYATNNQPTFTRALVLPP